MSILKLILSGELLFADCAVIAGQVELPVSFHKAYPRHNHIYVTNHICYDQRCVLLLTPAQFEEVAAEIRAAPKEREVVLFTMFFIGGAEEVSIASGTLRVAQPLLDYLGAYRSKPDTATLCWLPPVPPATKSLSRTKSTRRRIFVPA